MKKAAIWLLVFLLCAIPGRADSEQSTGDDVLSVKLEGFDASCGTAYMNLLIENRSSQSQHIYMIEPTFNGEPASFLNGWNTDEITLDACGSDRIEIAICAGGRDALPEAVSLRFAANGCISSPMHIRSGSSGLTITPASFDIKAPEALIASDQSAFNDIRLSSQTLSDRLSADEMSRLSYAQAVVCFREIVNNEELFVRFCTLPARVDEDGVAHADFSGYAVTFSQAPVFPLSTLEDVRDGQRVILVSRIVLSGEAAFYASLAFEIIEASDGSLSMGEYTITSEELGGIYHCAPYALFSSFSCANAVIQMDDSKGDTRSHIEDDRFISISLNRPLVVRLKPASELGDVYAYFEYFFTDNRSAVHAPFPL